MLVLPVKDTVGREPLLKVLTFLNQKQENNHNLQRENFTINIGFACPHKYYRSFTCCYRFSTTSVLIRHYNGQHCTVNTLRNIMHLQHSQNIFNRCHSLSLKDMLLDSYNKKVKGQSLDISLCRMFLLERQREREVHKKSSRSPLYRIYTG